MHIAAKNGIHHVIIANFARHVSPERYKDLKNRPPERGGG
ncbi:hypothetical protein UUU_11690 [Klebsiella pneumoniae subsp. pneumoniae DSM 30104 = JCM 1662 = NBRC 14940]|nr:hypothetical protein UUU_11690 [Klebsiella pneumoniae subsp. pneumoniae DSM 30104 = JCM 1662 = NBRC 14940]